MGAIEIHVNSIDFFVTPVTLRMPFRFGAVTLIHLPLCTARARVQTEGGKAAVGYSADLLAPKWFEKDPDKSLDQDSENLLRSARAAASLFAGRTGRVFDLWWSVYRERVPDSRATDALVRGFGVTLCERALVDAACRAAGHSFYRGLREDLFGFAPGEVHDALAGWNIADDLPVEPATSIFVRHTVGMADPLTPAEVQEPVDDGFPQALTDDIARYGLRYFKIKIGSGRDPDLRRLLRLAEILDDATFRFTLDANEQYTDLAELHGLLGDLGRDAGGSRLLERLLLIEQPLPRDTTFDPGIARDLASVSEIAPVIIDEADSGIDAFPRAVALGYRGVSVKNCKGVFRALLNRGLCEVLEGGLFQSGEDLTNLPVLALQQDLATLAALGIEHAERNGHHYFRGLDHLPAPLADQALARHSDLYCAHGDGVAVRIEDGTLRTASLQCAGYGYDGDLDLTMLCV